MLLDVLGVAVLVSVGRQSVATIVGVACVARRVRRRFPAPWW